MGKIKTVPHEDGLHFTCVDGCFDCCVGNEEGYVWLTEQNIKEISEHLQISQKDFIENFCKVAPDGSLSLDDVPEENYRCIFLKEGKCSIYDKRPLQCRTFPFWGFLLKDLERFKYVEEVCKGIGKGDYYSKEQVEEVINNQKMLDSERT